MRGKHQQQDFSIPNPPQLKLPEPVSSGSSFVPARGMLSATSPTEMLHLHCLYSSRVHVFKYLVHTVVMVGMRVGNTATFFFSREEQTLNEGPLRIGDRLMVPQGCTWHFKLQTDASTACLSTGRNKEAIAFLGNKDTPCDTTALPHETITSA